MGCLDQDWALDNFQDSMEHPGLKNGLSRTHCKLQPHKDSTVVAGNRTQPWL